MAAPSALRVEELRAVLQQRFPDAIPLRDQPQIAEPLGSGHPGLDAVFPGQGLPRAKLTVWAPGGGATALLRAIVAATVQRGERVAWVDPEGRIADAAGSAGALVVRPTSRQSALRSTEDLLRCGGFALVLLGSGDPQGTETVRLTRLAKEGGAGLVVLTERTALSALQVQSRLLAPSWRWHRSPFMDPAVATGVTTEVRSRALGWTGRALVALGIDAEMPRLALEGALRDRKGSEPTKAAPRSRARAASRRSSDAQEHGMDLQK